MLVISCIVYTHIQVISLLFKECEPDDIYSCYSTLVCVFRYKGQAPDLLGKQDSVYEGEVYYEHLMIITYEAWLLTMITLSIYLPDLCMFLHHYRGLGYAGC